MDRQQQCPISPGIRGAFAASRGFDAHGPFAAAADGQFEPRGGEWSVPWSDLMMVMFILFVVLFAFAARHGAMPQVFEEGAAGLALSDGGSGAAMVAPAVRSLHLEELSRRMRERLEPYADMTSVEHLPGAGVLVSLYGKGLMQDGELGPRTRQALAALAGLLPMARAQVMVSGYPEESANPAADPASIGSGFADAARQAALVAEDLVRNTGLDPRMFLVQGYGAALPAVPETSPTASRRNRRIEIVVTDIPL